MNNGVSQLNQLIQIEANTAVLKDIYKLHKLWTDGDRVKIK